LLVRSIALSNYRNYKDIQVDFDPHLNILTGGNAQGKTNILEAIFYAATGKSHRSSFDNELLSWGEKFFKVSLRGERRSGEVKIEIYVKGDGKKLLKVNNHYKKKLSDLIGTINVVLFSPEDMMLVKGSPSIRRRFLDIEISQVSPFYCHSLANYNRIISQRNNLLKAIREQRESEGLLDVWDLQLVEYGAYIIKKRDEVLRSIVQLARSIHSKITEGREQLDISYVSSVDMKKVGPGTSLEDLFLKKLRDNRSTEIVKGITMTGPHRDDITIEIGGAGVKSFGSQGQQRTCALSMKLAELEFMKRETGEYPILLLDDVMSELDAERRKYLLEVVNGRIQSFVTTTGVEEVFQPVKHKGRVFEVKKGQIFHVQEG